MGAEQSRLIHKAYYPSVWPPALDGYEPAFVLLLFLVGADALYAFGIIHGLLPLMEAQRGPFVDAPASPAEVPLASN